MPDAFIHYLGLFALEVCIVMIYVGGEVNIPDRENRGEELDVMMTKNCNCVVQMMIAGCYSSQSLSQLLPN